VILALQTARYLIKTVNEARGSQPDAIAGSVKYIGEEPLDPSTIDLDDRATRSASLVALLKDRARSMALDLAEDFNTATAAGAETFLLSKRHRFLSFPYVCPEPVLEK
jgi:hypothetical protein